MEIVMTKGGGNRSSTDTCVTTEKKNEGLFLTWKDLWVTVPLGKNDQQRPIIQGLTGYAQPGEILAIMGPSGCGKSTLLNALVGRLTSSTRQSGEILVNGRKQLLSFGMSAYVTQEDILMTTLTVKETVYYSAQLQLPNTMTKSEKKERAETTIKEMGLENAMNTRVGGWNNIGLSGGEKRRVSICLEILTRPKLLFLDEPTSGLDSAASYHVMNTVARLAKQDGRTVITSIHQPSNEVFDLFSNLCLLSSGRTVYFGLASAANEFFTLNGFPCPTMMNPSDHFLRTINKDFDQEIGQGLTDKPTTVEEAIDILVKSYKSSPTGELVERQIAEICRKEGGLFKVETGRQASFITQSLVLTKRSFVNMYRDLGYYWLRLGIYIVICLCIGTIFHNVGHSFASIQARGSMLMFVSSLLTLMAIGGFPSFVEDLKIFGSERLNGHYGVAAFVVGNTLSSIPFLLLNSLVPGAIAYYLVHLQPGFEHFVYFVLLLLSCTMLVESLMMIVASIVPNFLMGIIVGCGIQGVMMLTGGFYRLPNDLPKPFWRYPMYYFSFHKYANQGFYKNEFQGLSFPAANHQAGGGPSIITGEEILKDNYQMEVGHSKWVDLVILLGMMILCRILFFGMLKIIEKVKPMIRGVVRVARPFKHSKPLMVNPSTTPLYDQLLVYFLVEGFSHYWIHRWLHSKWGYEKIHHVHHEYAAPFGFAATYAHRSAVLMLGIPTLLGPAMVPGHMITFWSWITLRQMEAIVIHCGYDFPWNPIKFFPFYGGAEYHDYHHYVDGQSHRNFALVITYCDYIYGTDRGYRYQKQQLAAAGKPAY